MPRQPIIALLLISFYLFAVPAQSASHSSADLEQFNVEGDFSAVSSAVIEQTTFYGIAGYYNTVTIYHVDSEGIALLSPGESVTLAEGSWLAAVGRFNVLLLNTSGTIVEVGEETFAIANSQSLNLNASLVQKDQLKDIDPALDELRYYHLWWPFAQVALAVEWALVKIKAVTGLSWGIAIVIFTIVLKILMIPLGILSLRMQSQVSEHQSKLAPVLAEIKAKYDGEEAHTRIMAAYKEEGVSTLFALKPMLAMFIQLPIWIAVFNALGEMPQLNGESFLWISNLAYPDSIGTLPFAIPLLGSSISLLPVLMTLVTLAAAALLRDPHASEEVLQGQKRNLYWMALGFFVLFYPFPAAMVFYWTFSNALQIVQQQLIKT